MKNIMNTAFRPRGWVKPSSNASLHDLAKGFFESISVLSFRINEVYCGILECIKRCRNKCRMIQLRELSLVNSESTNNKQANDNKVDSPLTTHNSLVKATAFTLAETLVVMGIIGVVAALTIPNLNQSTGDREKVAKVKKIYANLEDAFGRATAVYGPIEEWFINLPEDLTANQRLADRMTEFMKISKNCGTGSGCFADGEYPELYGDSNSEEPNARSAEPKVLLADGTAFAFHIRFDDCSSADWGATSDSPVAKTCGLIYVDIDGPKGPNTQNKDYFRFYVTSTGIYPEGGKNSADGEDNGMLKYVCFVEGWICTGWVIETGNMDYLKANEGVCPNGTELSWENTSCK